MNRILIQKNTDFLILKSPLYQFGKGVFYFRIHALFPAEFISYEEILELKTIINLLSLIRIKNNYGKA